MYNNSLNILYKGSLVPQNFTIKAALLCSCFFYTFLLLFFSIS